MNHTPEPWEAETQLEGRPFIHTETTVVASCIHTPEIPREEASANARRIAACVNACQGINPQAVPDLLAACKHFVWKCENGWARSTESYKQMKAAIAKAER